jgi:hypothetical protein
MEVLSPQYSFFLMGFHFEDILNQNKEHFLIRVQYSGYSLQSERGLII